MSDNDKVWTIHVSATPERVYSFPQRELTDLEVVVFEFICKMLISAIGALPAEEKKLAITIPIDLGILSEEVISQVFNWLKLNNWKPIVYADFFRRLSALRI